MLTVSTCTRLDVNASASSNSSLDFCKVQSFLISHSLFIF